jgi:hypothetical protein
MKTTTIIIGALLVTMTAMADDQRKAVRRSSEPNWIIERQTAAQVEGVPTSRRIIGKREIDIYPDGRAFERGNRVN